MLDSTLTAVAAAIFLLAGVVKGFSGMGLPTLSMGLLGLIMPVSQAAALLVIPAFVSNLWQLAAAGRQPVALAGRLWPLLLPMAPSTYVASQWLMAEPVPHAKAALGVLLLIYAALGLARLRIAVARRAEAVLSPAVGLITGLVTGATGLFMFPVVPYLEGLDLSQDEFLQAVSLSFTVSTLSLAAAVASQDVMNASLGLSIICTPPALVGMAAGQALRRRLDPSLFRLGFFVVLMLVAGALLVS